MSKAIQAAVGAAEILAGVAVIYFSGGALAPLGVALIGAGLASEVAVGAEAIAAALNGQQGQAITIHQSAGLRKIVYGICRIIPDCVYESTTGAGGSGGNYVYNKVCCVASHEIDAYQNLYFDGRQVFFRQDGNPANIGCGTVDTPPATVTTLTAGAVTGITASGGSGFANLKPTRYRVRIVDPTGLGSGARAWATLSGGSFNSSGGMCLGSAVGGTWTVSISSGGANYSSGTYAEIQGKFTFGGVFSDGQHDPSQGGYGLGYGIGPDGAHYNFDGKGFAEVRFGDQLPGEIMTSLSANDSNWDGYGSTYAQQATAGVTWDPITFQVDAVTPVIQGYGYSTPPTVTFSGGGGAVFNAIVSGGRVVGYQKISGGSYPGGAPTVSIGPPNLGAGLGAAAGPNGMGVAYCYVNYGYDADQYPQPPEMRFTINGKNDLFDPRTGQTGFSLNWALQVNDVLSNANPMFGLGDPVNQAQLIAAANVCDERILTSQGYESNMLQSLQYDTSTSPGDALELMMPTAQGRVSWIGGEWYIWPAYWQGPSFTADENTLAGEISWEPYRDPAELFNCVNGTYVAPNYPYSTAGNLYDQNGWYYGTIDNIWPFQFQPTNFPQYARDPLHGYGTAEDLLADGGIVLPKEIAFRGIPSIVQAQRMAKIALMRNRYQGSGSFPMQLAALAMQSTDVMQFSFALFGWVGKSLEIVTMTPTRGQAKADDEAAPLIIQVKAIETAEEIYEWSITEELSPYDVPSVPPSMPYNPAPPTGLALASGSAAAVVGLDGVTTPRIHVTWTAPDDVTVSQVLVQYKLHASGTWLDAGAVNAALTSAFVGPVVAGGVYDVQIAAVRPRGSISAWLQQLSYTTDNTVLSAIPVAQITGLVAGAVGGLAASATTDTTNAANIGSGTLPAARLPVATSSVLGAARADNSTIVNSGGVLSLGGLPPTTGMPSTTPAAGTPAYDAAADKLWIYDGSAWKGVVLT